MTAPCDVGCSGDLYCNYSDLPRKWCAHCLGHTLSPEHEAVSQ